MATKIIYIQTWTEFERGWGSRPDGASLHLTKEDAEAFVVEYNKVFNNEKSAPDEYTVSDRNPKLIEVDSSVQDELKLRIQTAKTGDNPQVFTRGKFITNTEDSVLRKTGKLK